MNFTLNQLKIFVKVVEHQSITRAADQLYLTQPAVSIQLKNFQDLFDIPLTEVINKRLYITDFGHETAKAAKSILEEANSITYKRAAFQGKLSGKIKLSVVSTGKYVIPFLLSDFLKENPEIDLELDVSNSDNVIRHLENNEVDYALMTRLPEAMSLSSVELMENNLVLVGGKGSREDFSRNKNAYFKRFPFIFREKGSATRKAMKDYLQLNGYHSEKNITLTSNEAVKQAVISGMGCSIVPLIGIKNELHLGQLEVLSAPGLPIKSSWYMVHLKEKKHSPTAKEFLKHLIDKRDSILFKHFDWVKDFEF
ncbi:MAG: LysR family transcriptional regulator [Crocinitomicaceae bacterium]